MLEAGQNPRFPANAALEIRFNLAVCQDLQSHGTVKLLIVCPKNRAHSALSDLFHQAVARARAIRPVGDLAKMLDHRIGKPSHGLAPPSSCAASLRNSSSSPVLARSTSRTKARSCR